MQAPTGCKRGKIWDTHNNFSWDGTRHPHVGITHWGFKRRQTGRIETSDFRNWCSREHEETIGSTFSLQCPNCSAPTAVPPLQPLTRGQPREPEATSLGSSLNICVYVYIRRALCRGRVRSQLSANKEIILLPPPLIPSPGAVLEPRVGESWLRRGIVVA